MRTTILLILVFMIFSGCSSSLDQNSITGQSLGVNGISYTINSFPTGVSEWFADGSPSGGEGVLGLFSLKIDPKTSSASLFPLRKSSLTDVLEVVDITNFLQLSPCTDCVKIKSVSLDTNGNLVIAIGIKHPFDAGNPFKPVSGRNRADLHVFNVEGIVVSNEEGASFSGIGETIARFSLLNADGYTGYLDSSLDDIFETDATIHPYILHFDDYSQGNFSASNSMGFESVTDPPPSGNLVMAMGCDYNFQDYVFDIDESMEFIYVVGCTYGVSAANKNQRFQPEYRIPQHNKKAASEVRVEIIDNNLKSDDTNSSAELAVKVLDMNHGVAIGSSLDQMLADSSVAEISVEIPGVTTSPVVVLSPVPTGGDSRDPLNPLDFPITVTNSANASEGTYTGIVKVLDSYSPGLNSSPLLNSKDGIKRVDPLENPIDGTFHIDEFATYAVFTIDVALGAQLEACFVADPEEARIEVDPTINFDGSCSNDPNGYNIVSFEWDFDWDGDPADFTADETNSIPTTSHIYSEPGTYTVALKVKNDAVPQETSDIFSDDVIVHGWVMPPVKLSSSDVHSSMIWFYSNRQIVSTPDGKVHVLVEDIMQTYMHNANYYLVDENGTVETEALYVSNEIVDVGLVPMQNNDVYAFYVKLTNGEVCYRLKGPSGFGPEVHVVDQEPGNYTETAGFTVNPDGDICVVSAETRDCPQPSQIFMTLNEGSGFVKTQIGTAYTYIECDGPTGSGVMIQVDAIADSTGKFHMAWVGKITSDNSTKTNLYYVYYDGSPSPVSTISTYEYSGSPVLRVDADDNVFCAYMTNISVDMAIKPAGNNSFDSPFTLVSWIPGVTLLGHCSFDINQSNGDIMLVYDVRTSPSWDYSCWSKIFNVSNTPLEMKNALEFRIYELSPYWHWWPYVAQNVDGHWYAIWDDHTNFPFPAPHGDLYFAMYY